MKSTYCLLIILYFSLIECEKMDTEYQTSGVYRGNPEVEGCVACRFIWENIEESLGNDGRNSILSAESFQYFCKMSPDIFFTPCNQMFEQLYEMSENFSNKMNVMDICKKASMCH